MEKFSLTAALVCLALSLILSLWRRRNPGLVGAVLAVMGFGFLTLALVSRAVATGHGPFPSMYEFSLAFAWGVTLMAFIFAWRYRANALRTVGVVIAILLLLFARTLPSRPTPLVPALQQSFLLTAHVAAAMISYGALAIGFGAALLYLIGERTRAGWLPRAEVLDEISYHSVLIGFPFMTLLIVLGALWADVAWGRYWSWDPKETASLVTWLIYAGYLHARVLRGWRGTRSAVLLVIGFLAILLIFFGSFIFEGLHSY